MLHPMRYTLDRQFRRFQFEEDHFDPVAAALHTLKHIDVGASAQCGFQSE